MYLLFWYVSIQFNYHLWYNILIYRICATTTCILLPSYTATNVTLVPAEVQSIIIDIFDSVASIRNGQRGFDNDQISAFIMTIHYYWKCYNVVMSAE